MTGSDDAHTGPDNAETRAASAEAGPNAGAAAADEQLALRRYNVNRATRRGLAAVLCLEAFVVLLVPRAIAQTPTGLSGPKVGLLVGFAALLVVVSALLRRRWGVGVGSLLHLPLLLIGIWVHAFFIVGVLFMGVWLYLLNLRHELAGTPGGVRMLVS